MNAWNPKESSVAAFLEGRGPNPFPEEKRDVGPATQAFLDAVDKDNRAQDKANSAPQKVDPLENLLNVLRLLNDNRELIDLIREGAFESVSELAVKSGKEVSNVSRTLSRLAAHGVIAFERGNLGAKKKPYLLLPLPVSDSLEDWGKTYCLVQFLTRSGLNINITPESLVTRQAKAVYQAIQLLLLQSGELSERANRAFDESEAHPPSKRPCSV